MWKTAQSRASYVTGYVALTPSVQIVERHYYILSENVRVYMWLYAIKFNRERERERVMQCNETIF